MIFTASRKNHSTSSPRRRGSILAVYFKAFSSLNHGSLPFFFQKEPSKLKNYSSHSFINPSSLLSMDPRLRGDDIFGILRKSLNKLSQPLIVTILIFVAVFLGNPAAQAQDTLIQDEKSTLTQPTVSMPGTEPPLTQPGKATDMYGVVERVVEDGDRVINGQKEHYQRLTIRLDERLTDTSAINLKQPTTPINRVTVENSLGDNPAYQLWLKPGSRVLLTQQEETSSDDPESRTPTRQYTVVSLDRTPGLWILLTLTVLSLFLIGGQHLTRAMAIWFLFTVSAWNLLLPLIVAGSGSAWLLLAFLCLLLPLAMNSLHKIDNGLSSPAFAHWKQWICTRSVWVGTLVQFGILFFMQGIAQLNGHTSVSLNELWDLHPQTQYWALYVSGTLLGFQGFLYALCHRSLESLTQAQLSTSDDNPIPFKARFWILWAMSRQKMIPLFIALGFLSTCFSLPLMLEAQNNSLAQFINQESVASAITFMLSGCLSLLLTIPILSFLAARYYPRVK